MKNILKNCFVSRIVMLCAIVLGLGTFGTSPVFAADDIGEVIGGGVGDFEIVPPSIDLEVSDYTITVKPNGATSHTSDIVFQAKAGLRFEDTSGNVITSIPVMTRTGFTLKGYYDAASGGNMVIPATGVLPAVTTFTADTTLYARWTPVVYTITLDAKRYTSSTATSGTSATTNVSPTKIYEKYNTGWYRSTIAVPANSISSVTIPQLTGYTFGGFWTGKTGTGTQVIDSSGNIISGKTTTFTSSSTLYAKWTQQTYTITLNDNGGSGGQGSVTVTYGEMPPTLTKLPTRDGYKFMGYAASYNEDQEEWKEQLYDEDGVARYEYTTSGNTTLIAMWEAAPYTVTLHSDGCDGFPKTIQIKQGEMISDVIANPTTCACGAFNGWYDTTDPDENSSQYHLYPWGFHGTPTDLYALTTNSGAGCDAGYYLPTATSSGNGGEGCTKCPAGSFCPGVEPNVCSVSGPVGKTDCENGYRSDAGSYKASQCYISVPAGKYMDTAKGSTLKDCPAGYSCPATRVYYGDTVSPQKCSAGYYSAANASSCSPCGKGNFCPSGATAPQVCTGNTYSESSTASSCTSCSSGYTISGTTAANHDSKSDCKITCSAGTYVKTAGGACVKTPSGYYIAGQTVSEGTTQTPTQCPKDPTTSIQGTTAKEGTSAVTACFITKPCSTSGVTGTGKQSCNYNTDTGKYDSRCTQCAIDNCPVGYELVSGSCAPKTFTITLVDTRTGGNPNIVIKQVYNTKWTNSTNETITVAPIQTRSGYNFDGYYDAASGGNKVIGADGTLPSNTKYTADAALFVRWIPKTYVIKYVSYESGKLGEQTCTVGQSCIVGDAVKSAINQTGSTFSGIWTNDEISCGQGEFNQGDDLINYPTCAEKFADENNYEFPVLKAHFTPNTYYIKYDANGGNGTVPSNTKCTYGLKCNLVANPFNKTGSNFLGWSKKSNPTANDVDFANNGHVPANASLTATNGATVTLYAVWGTCAACDKSSEGSYCTLDTSSGSCVYKSGCNAGYSKQSTSTDYKPVCSANKLRIPVYQLKLDMEENATPLTYVETYYNKPLPKLDLSKITRRGYTFYEMYGASYNQSDDDYQLVGGVFYDTNGNPTGSPIRYTNLKLYATWTANSYMVELDPVKASKNGTAVLYYSFEQDDPCKYYLDSTLEICAENNKIESPARVGYSFRGYYTENDGNGDEYVDDEGTISDTLYTTVANDSTLYANYNANTYTLSYSCGDGATGTPPASRTATFDQYIALGTEIGTCVKTGYSFDGWTTTDDSGKTVTHSASTPFQWKYANNKTFAIKWKPDCYQINLDNSEGDAVMIFGNNYNPVNDGIYFSDNQCSNEIGEKKSFYNTPIPNSTFLGYYSTDGKQCIGSDGKTTGNCPIYGNGVWRMRFQCNDGYTANGTIVNSISGIAECKADCNSLEVCYTPVEGESCADYYMRTGDNTQIYADSKCDTETYIEQEHLGYVINGTPLGLFDAETEEQCLTQNGYLTGNCSVTPNSLWIAKYECEDGYTGIGSEVWSGDTCLPDCIEIEFEYSENGFISYDYYYFKPGDYTTLFKENCYTGDSIEEPEHFGYDDNGTFVGFYGWSDENNDYVACTDQDGVLTGNCKPENDVTWDAFYQCNDGYTGYGSLMNGGNGGVCSSCYEVEFNYVPNTNTGVVQYSYLYVDSNKPTKWYSDWQCTTEFSESQFDAFNNTTNAWLNAYLDENGNACTNEYGDLTGNCELSEYTSWYAQYRCEDNYKYNDSDLIIPSNGESCSLVTTTVTLDANGGSGGTASVIATYGSAMSSITKPTRVGYTFNGYYDAASGGKQYYTASGTSARNWDKTSNTTLYAQWEQCPAGKYEQDGVCVTCPSNSRSEAGATECTCYDGYNYNGGTTTTTEACVPNQYTITLNMNGGTANGAPEQIYEKPNYGWYGDEDLTQKIDNIGSRPLKNYYFFGGFFTEQNGTGTQVIASDGRIIAPNFLFNSDATIYAYYTKCECTLGDGVSSCTVETTEEPICRYKVICNGGYSDNGNITDNGGATTYTTFGYLYTVTCKKIGAQTGYTCPADSTKYISCFAGNYMATMDASGNYVYNGTPTVNNSCEPCPDDAAYCPGGTSAPLYAVTLDAEGLQSEYSILLANVNAEYYKDLVEDEETGNLTATRLEGTLPAEFIPTAPVGKTFNGYWTQSQGGEQYIDANGNFIKGPSADVTLYAQWEQNQYIISYACGYGDGTAPSQTTCDAGTKCLLANSTCAAPAGHMFFGWRIDNKTIDNFTDINTVLSAGTYTATAQYEEIEPEFKMVAYPMTALTTGNTQVFGLTGVQGTFLFDCGNGESFAFFASDDTSSITPACKYSKYKQEYEIKIASVDDPTITKTSPSIFKTRASDITKTYNSLITKLDGSLGKLFNNNNNDLSIGFVGTFGNATRLTDISPTLLDGFSKLYSVSTMFYGNTSLENIPLNLLTPKEGCMTYISSGAAAEMFAGSTNLSNVTDWDGNVTSYLPASLYERLNSCGTVGAYKRAFTNTALADTCPAGTYEVGQIGTKPACAPCPSNSSSEAGATECTCNTGYNYNGGTTTTTNACVANQYTVTFNANGGTGSMSTQTFIYGIAQNLTANAFTRTGYAFGGWNTASDGSGTSYADKASVKNLTTENGATITLYAQWSQSTFTIKYYDGSTELTNLTPTTYNVTSSTITLPTPSKTGYTFGGWYDNSGLTGTAVTQIATGSTGNKTFWAKWTKDEYTITYNLNGGTNNASNPAKYSVDTATITLANASKTGYTFGGWYSDANFTTKVTQIAKGSTGNKTFWAKWTTDAYTITYNLDGGTNNASNPDSYDVTTDTITLANPSKTGYTFGGWYSDANFATKVTQIAKGSTGNKTFWAKWTTDAYTITYNLDGGTNNASNPDSYDVTTATITLANATKTGYTFGGWYSDANFATKVTQIATGSTGNKTLYAKWTIKSDTCEPGEYLPKSATSCTTCPVGYACTGGTFSYDSTKDQGISACSGATQYQNQSGQATCKTVSDGYYKKDNTAQTECGNGYYCKNTVRTVCPDNGLTDTATASDVTDCYKDNQSCTVNGGFGISDKCTFNTTQNDYKNCTICIINSCNSGYYKDNNTCTICPKGSYCVNNELHACPDEYTTSGTGASQETECFISCSNKNVEYGTAHPDASKAFAPSVCTYTRGTSITGNPCDIIDGVCVETSCKYNYEMKEGKCAECVRDNALSFKQGNGNCVVESCIYGFHPSGKECVPAVKECDILPINALSAAQSWNTTINAYDTCKITECVDGYHIDNNVCISDTQTCELRNGTGKRTWNHALNKWDECIAEKCYPGYTTNPDLTNETWEQCGKCSNAFSDDGEEAVSSYIDECEILFCKHSGEKYILENNECRLICNEFEDETGSRYWDSKSKKCVHTCNAGYKEW